MNGWTDKHRIVRAYGLHIRLDRTELTPYPALERTFTSGAPRAAAPLFSVSRGAAVCGRSTRSLGIANT